MAYTVHFGKITKKRNSTKDSMAILNISPCSLKMPSDILRPVFTFQGDFPLTANYMYVPDFNRFYWITNTVFTYGHWEVSGQCDPLASYKNEIGASTQYILRSSAEYNTNLIDNLIPVETAPYSNTILSSMGLSIAGTYIVCAAGSTGNNYYLLTSSEWSSLYAKVFSSQFLQDYKNVWDAFVTEISNTVLKPDDYVISAIWIPFAVDSGESANISLGFTNTGVTGRIVHPGDVLHSHSVTLTVPDHPQKSTYGDFCNSNMFRKVSLTIPGYGTVPLNADALMDGNDVVFSYAVDVTGTVYANIQCGATFTALSFKVSTDAGFSVTRTDIPTALMSASIGALSATANPIGLAQGIASALNSVYPSVERSCQGASGALASAGISSNLALTTVCYYLGEIPNSVSGRALCKVKTPAELGGYMQCQSPALDLAATATEMDEILRYMEGGFYYE